MTEVGRITNLLKQRADGGDGVDDELYEAVYPELIRVARRQLQRRRGRGETPTLEPSDLVQESVLSVIGKEPEFANSRHYYSFMTTVILRALMDYQRGRRSQKRGGDAVHVTLTGIPASRAKPATSISDLSRLLDRLRELDPRKVEVVELRFFWGLEMAEIADLLDVSTRTAERDWRFARAWLSARLAPDIA